MFLFLEILHSLKLQEERREFGKDISLHLGPNASELFKALKKISGSLLNVLTYCYFLPYLTMYLLSDAISLPTQTKLLHSSKSYLLEEL